MTRAAIIARVSDPRQADKDRHSLPSQLADMHAWAEREGWDVVKVYEIPGESAFRDYLDERPQFSGAIQDALAGLFDVLLVFDISRFARSQAVLHVTLRDLKRVGVKLLVAVGEWDATDDPLRAGIEGIIAQDHSVRQSQKIRRAYEHRHHVGLPTGSTPFGYRWVGADAPPALIPEEAEAVRRVFRSYGAGETLASIAAALNEEGHRPRTRHRAATGAFTASSVQSLVENRFYLGFVTHHGSERKGQHERAIDEAEWEYAQRRFRPRGPHQRREVLLSGLATCLCCTSAVWVKTAGEMRHPYYFDSATRHRLNCPVGAKVWRTEEVDGLIEATVLGIGDIDSWLEEAARLVRKPQRRGKSREQLAATKARLWEAYVAGVFGKDELNSRLAAVDAELSALLEQEPYQLAEAGARLSSIAEAWSYLTVTERAGTCRILFKSVGLDLKERQVAYAPAKPFADLIDARAVWVSEVTGTPDRTRGSLVPSLYTLADLGVAA